MKYFVVSLTVIVLWLSQSVGAAEPDAGDIFSRAYELKRVDDQVASLTFSFIEPGHDQRQVVYTMVWKNMRGKDGYDNKAMFFTESPADRRGIGYLGWLVPADSAEQDDEWIYLPELRTTRRIAHRDRDHTSDDDEFGKSLLTREQLDPRPPGLDTHRLVDEKILDDSPHYLVASTPKQHSDTGTVIRWIDKDTYRIDRSQYFDAKGMEILDVRYLWTQVDGYWLWKTVTATNPVSQEKTVLEIDIRSVNSGLSDREFSKRILERGSGKFR